MTMMRPTFFPFLGITVDWRLPQTTLPRIPDAPFGQPGSASIACDRLPHNPFRLVNLVPTRPPSAQTLPNNTTNSSTAFPTIPHRNALFPWAPMTVTLCVHCPAYPSVDLRLTFACCPSNLLPLPGPLSSPHRVLHRARRGPRCRHLQHPVRVPGADGAGACSAWLAGGRAAVQGVAGRLRGAGSVFLQIGLVGLLRTLRVRVYVCFEEDIVHIWGVIKRADFCRFLVHVWFALELSSLLVFSLGSSAWRLCAHACALYIVSKLLHAHMTSIDWIGYGTTDNIYGSGLKKDT